jgi:uncharacterized repeat protein (TIGR03803 family)
MSYHDNSVTIVQTGCRATPRSDAEIEIDTRDRCTDERRNDAVELLMVLALNVRGMTVGASFLLVGLAVGAQARPVEVLHSFMGPAGDGRFVEAPLLLEPDGTVYETTAQGGVSNDYGTVFKIAPNGTVTLLHSFTLSEGRSSAGGLVMDDAGNLFGTQSAGGASNFGTVFALAPNGGLTVLHSFSGGMDGTFPGGMLARDKRGNLYGTTSNGGASTFGTAFQVTPTGKEKVIYTFTGFTDGSEPASGLIADKKGDLYGTATSGGDASNGVVFKLTRGAGKQWTESVLYSFQGGGDGEFPAGNLVFDRAGNLYGMTTGNACFGGGGCGTVFKLAPNGVETVLHVFASVVGQSDGAIPTSVAIDRRGDLFGTTRLGGGTGCGGNGCGTVFTISTASAYRMLHIFKGADGSEPAALVRNSAGDLLGGSNSGGTANDGVVF